MSQIEINKFYKKINGESISLSAKRALRDVVDNFFSRDYQNISEKRKLEIESEFAGNFLMTTARVYPSDRPMIDEILNQIKNDLFTILDHSVEKKITEIKTTVTTSGTLGIPKIAEVKIEKKVETTSKLR